MNTAIAEFKGLYGPDNKRITVDPVVKKDRVKRSYVTRYFGYAEEKKLLGLVSSIKGKLAERDRMIMDVDFNTGLRVSELASLTVGHVRLKEKLTIVGKGNKERIVPINKGLQRSIKDYIRQKLVWKESIHDDAPLFVSKKGGGLKKRSLEEMFETWCIEAGLTTAGFGVQGSGSGGQGPGSGVQGSGRVKSAYTFHCMRHTFAMRLRERGYSIEQVGELLGHSSLNSTRVYFRPSMEELTEAVESL